MKLGSLTIIGTGIQAIGQTTLEAKTYIQQAEKVLFAVADPLTATWIQQLNPQAEFIHTCIEPKQNRWEIYQEIVETILSFVRQNLKVCVAFYGHPGIFVYPSHEAIKLARAEGYSAKMLPGVSAEDCLFADLGVDPALNGCQSFEATDFLVYKRRFDTSSALILWQIGVVGDLSYNPEPQVSSYLDVLVNYLQQHYSPEHEVIIYEAAQYSICDPVICRVQLAEVSPENVTLLSTLYIPPKAPATPDPEMLERLGLTQIRQEQEQEC